MSIIVATSTPCCYVYFVATKRHPPGARNMTNIEATADRIIATGASKRDVIILAGKAAAELIAAGVPKDVAKQAAWDVLESLRAQVAAS